MDRTIDTTTLRLRIARRIAVAIGLVLLVAAGLVFLPRFIKPTLARTRIRTAKVTSGPIEAVVTASGNVVPELEQVLSSPIDARILKIHKRPGATVRQGEPILTLDVSQSELALERIKQQIELKQNQQAKAKLDLETTLNTLRGQLEVKTLDYKSFKANTLRQRALFDSGLLSKEKLGEAELAEQKAESELRQLEASIATARKSTDTQIAGLALEMKTLAKEREEAARQLELATTKADRDGVLTFVVAEEGATVAKGAVLARLADLRSFRVDATVSDVHAARLTAGMPVTVKINDRMMKGSIATIDPTITNGVITVRVALAEQPADLLRSNLRVDVLIAVERKNEALRVKKGPFAGAQSVKDVFVVNGDRAVKRPVKLGIASFDELEILSGLSEGDEIIVSDMTEFQHLAEITLK